MSYLTKSEKQMEFNMRKAQYYLGIQCSLNKGDGKEMKELMNELIDDALQEGKKQGALKELKRIESIICNFDFSKLNTDCFVKTNKYIGRIAEYIYNKREKLQGVEQK